MSDASDPYLYPGTNVLRNIPGLRDAARLAAFEASKTAQRIYEIRQEPLPGRFDSSHLKAIHHYVFTWAGKFRTTVLGKAAQIGVPPTWFTAPYLLDEEAERIFGALHRANLLRGLGRVPFARQCAQLMARINNLHPFREGNGRTQRLFIHSMARAAGHELHFDVVSRERMVRASIAANGGDLGMMVRMIEEISDLARIQPLRRAIAFLSREKFNWNATYVATAAPGEDYAGKLVGRDGESFMMRSVDDRILIGCAADIDPASRPGEHIQFRASQVSGDL